MKVTSPMNLDFPEAMAAATDPSGYANAHPQDLTVELRGPMDDEVMRRLTLRNEERLKAAQKALGSRWVLYKTRMWQMIEAKYPGAAPEGPPPF